MSLCCFDNVRVEPRGTMTERQTSIDGRLILSEGLENWTIGAARAVNYEPGCAAPDPTPESPGLAAMLVDVTEERTDMLLQRAANKLWWWKRGGDRSGGRRLVAETSDEMVRTRG